MVAETSLRDRRSRLLAEPGLRGQEFCRRYAAEADAWLSGLAERAAGDVKRHLALVAVGGYGRSSLCPYSDLDVVLVHTGHRDIAKIADAIWYPVWDEGVHLDHSVRRPSEVLSAAAEDVRVALGLLDGRIVWGEAKVAEPLLERARAAWRDRLGARYLPMLQQQMAERRATAGDVAFLLEPDLKESHGGLRDVSVLRAISAFAPLLADYADLDSLNGATALLTDIRVELHRLAQREHDKLLLQDQDQVAAALGFVDADALMLAVSTAGRQIAWVSDDVWRRRRLWDPTPPPKRRFRRNPSDHTTLPTPVDLGPDLVEVDGEITLTSLAPVSDDASLPLRLAATAAELDRPIAKGSLHRLDDRMPPPGDPWTDETRAALVSLLALGRPAIDKIESLDQHGLLVRLIPEWAAVRNKPQRNAYHTYTVDRHLLEAAALAAELADTVERPDLLLVGTLLHDIGKGFPGDHTTVGIEVVDRITTRMGFAPADVAVLVDLVRQHLLLPDTATRRDLDDPTTIARVAQAVGNRLTLHLLAALTEADSRATGPSAWGPWKAGLVADLVERTDRMLQGETEPTPPDRIVTSNQELMAEVRAEDSRRSHCNRLTSLWRHRTGPGCSPPWRAPSRSTAWTCGPPTSAARTEWPSRSSPSRSPGGHGPIPPNCARTSPRCSPIASRSASDSPSGSASTRSAAAPPPTYPEAMSRSTTRPPTPPPSWRFGRWTRSACSTASPVPFSMPASMWSRPGSPRSAKWSLTPSTSGNPEDPRSPMTAGSQRSRRKLPTEFGALGLGFPL